MAKTIKKIRKNIDLSEAIVKKHETLAKLSSRKVKNYMEQVLINHVTPGSNIPF